ncbi:hypothetical protein PROFUN_14929 [Planoprotostelium fungivorum]|uniref:Uncharacterized protein n=1 Tax=Planoprotostelium fungivorum TaxID=1890364 RepID=A0A2P6MYA2_9EUKA|nr:hypothetical protein PROFUN_14929 [Planoprotostelium fungivorum]
MGSNLENLPSEDIPLLQFLRHCIHTFQTQTTYVVHSNYLGPGLFRTMWSKPTVAQPIPNPVVTQGYLTVD